MSHGQRQELARIHWVAREILPHETLIRRRLMAHLPAGLELDDVIQESYAIVARIQDVARIRDPVAYFFTAARSVILQHLRRAQVVTMETFAEVDAIDRVVWDHSTEHAVSSRQELDQVLALVERLPLRCRQVLVMRRVEGYSQREIAARLQISQGTVEKHMSKAIRLLADAMARQDRPARSSTLAQPGPGVRYARR